jgi:hypothetical protein
MQAQIHTAHAPSLASNVVAATREIRETNKGFASFEHPLALDAVREAGVLTREFGALAEHVTGPKFFKFDLFYHREDPQGFSEWFKWLSTHLKLSAAPNQILGAQLQEICDSYCVSTGTPFCESSIIFSKINYDEMLWHVDRVKEEGVIKDSDRWSLGITLVGEGAWYSEHPLELITPEFLKSVKTTRDSAGNEITPPAFVEIVEAYPITKISAGAFSLHQNTFQLHTTSPSDDWRFSFWCDSHRVSLNEDFIEGTTGDVHITNMHIISRVIPGSFGLNIRALQKVLA